MLLGLAGTALVRARVAAGDRAFDASSCSNVVTSTIKTTASPLMQHRGSVASRTVVDAGTLLGG